jgi:hypothetical protein
MAREALEAEYGGEIQVFLRSFSQPTLEDPRKFAEEAYKAFGSAALPYYVTIVKYADSGAYNPEEEAEDLAGEEDFASLVRDVESESAQSSEPDSEPQS